MKHCIKLYFEGIDDLPAMFHKKFIIINILEALTLALRLEKKIVGAQKLHIELNWGKLNIRAW